jgi:Acyl-CoA dehydrogenase, C-terminal domain
VIDFSRTDEQLALADAAAGLLRGCDDCGGADAGDATWRALADFGAWGLLTESGGGSLGDGVALAEALGAGLCPGPVVASVAAGAVLTTDEARALAGGHLRVSVAVGGYVPWLSTANLVLEVDGDHVWRVTAEPEEKPVICTLSGEPWVPARITRISRVDNGVGFIVAAELMLAASLLGMARVLVDRGATHARTREQFGRPIGGFQGVAHPLADAWSDTTAAAELVRLVAAEQARGGSVTTFRARLARDQAASAALRTAYVVHQAMGGLSFAVESGIGTITTRVRQWSLLLPSPRSLDSVVLHPPTSPDQGCTHDHQHHQRHQQ